LASTEPIRTPPQPHYQQQIQFQKAVPIRLQVHKNQQHFSEVSWKEQNKFPSCITNSAYEKHPYPQPHHPSVKYRQEHNPTKLYFGYQEKKRKPLEKYNARKNLR